MGKVRDYHADGLWDPEGHPDVTTIFGTKTFYCFLDFHVFLPEAVPTAAAGGTRSSGAGGGNYRDGMTRY
jgi:hypothetical protein